MELIIASQNANKIKEISSKLPGVEIKPLSQRLFPTELREDGTTLEENALQKVRQVYAKTNADCFADDTGLEIEALNNDPGVYSARYAGPEKNSEDNMKKVLDQLADKSNRHARFRTVIALIFKGKEYLFEGICQGSIAQAKQGDQGFGYDPIFVPEGHSLSFAQMSLEDKNKISHRGRAVEQLVQFIEKEV